MGRTDFIKKIVEALQLDVNLEETPYAIGKTFVPVIPLKIPPKTILFTPTEAEWIAGFNVPAGKKWRIISASILWTSDVNAGNREIIFRIRQGSNILFVGSSRNFQVASTGVIYSFFIGAGNVGSSSAEFQTVEIPKDLILSNNAQIQVFDNAGIAAGDTLTFSTLVVEEEELISGEIETR